MSLDAFTTAYIQAALGSSNDESDESGGVPLDENYSADDLAPATLARIKADCKKFQEDNWEHMFTPQHGEYNSQYKAGHDFWLTRCGHGCGFWDGDWAEPAASHLTQASRAFGNVDLYVGDDGLIYC